MDSTPTPAVETRLVPGEPTGEMASAIAKFVRDWAIPPPTDDDDGAIYFDNGHARQLYRAMLAAAPARPAVETAPWVARVMECREEYDGFWRACSGCQESVEGHVSQRDYPYSAAFGCQPGGGCGECGGLGVIWDTTDYDAMADDIIADMKSEEEATAHPAAEPVDDMAMRAQAAWHGDPVVTYAWPNMCEAQRESWRRVVRTLYTHPAPDAVQEIERLEGLHDPKNWRDKPDQWTAEIEAAHPANSDYPNCHECFETAMEMVGNRRGKYELVALASWLLARAEKAEARVAELEATVADQRRRLDRWEPKPYCPPSVSSNLLKSQEQPK